MRGTWGIIKYVPWGQVPYFEQGLRNSRAQCKLLRGGVAVDEEGRGTPKSIVALLIHQMRDLPEVGISETVNLAPLGSASATSALTFSQIRHTIANRSKKMHVKGQWWWIAELEGMASVHQRTPVTANLGT